MCFHPSASLLLRMLHGAQFVPAGRFKLALVQMAVGADKAANVRRACQMVKEAVQNGAGMVVLPVRGKGRALLGLL